MRHRIFCFVLTTSTVSNIGGMIQLVGASWLMVSINGSATMVALVQASVTLSFMLLALIAGAVADSFQRRTVMLIAQIFMLLISALLLAVALLDLVTPWSLLLLCFLVGCGTVFSAPAWLASIGDMVPRPELPSAVSLNSMSYNLGRSLGPGVGGAIVAVGGATTAFLINTVSYVGLIVVLLRWRPRETASILPRESVAAAMAGGLRYVAMPPAIKVVLIRCAHFGFASAAVHALLPLIARDLVGGGALVFGLLLGAFGLGAIGGATLAAQLRRTLPAETIIRRGACALAVATALAAVSSHLPLTAAAMALAGGSWVMTISTFNVTVQLHSPRWVVARALSIYQMAAFGGMTLGAWLWGELTQGASLSLALLVAAGLQFGNAVIGLWLPLPDDADGDFGPTRAFEKPETAFPIENRNGPITVAIEYRIAGRNEAEFLTAMSERRRIRRRDGARHWTLLRDLSTPDLWIERFDAPTWLDYLRHASRRAHDDELLRQQIRALHQGKEPLKVRHMMAWQTGPAPVLDEGS